jgi:DNA-directed RNA polymerase specialized sigma24 family protein
VDAVTPTGSEAFERLLDDETPALCSVAALLGPSDEAFDVVERVWLDVIEEAERGAPFSALSVLAMRRLLERLATPLPLVVASGDERYRPGPFLPDDDRWAGSWEDDGPMPWERLRMDRVLSEDDRDVVVEALHCLPARYRVVVVVRDAGGLPLDDVSWVLGLTRDETRMLLHRARTELVGTIEGLVAPAASGAR